MEGWTPLFEGDIEGRHVKLHHYPTGELRVETTQDKTQVIRGSIEPGATIFPSVISEGDPIHIDAESAADLLEQLKSCGFSETGAKEICRHAMNPGVKQIPK